MVFGTGARVGTAFNVGLIYFKNYHHEISRLKLAFYYTEQSFGLVGFGMFNLESKF